MCYFPDNNFQLIKTNVSSTDWSNNNFCGVKTAQGRSSIPACSAPHTCPAATACEQRLTSDSCGGGGFEFCSTISEAHLFLNIGALRKPFNAVTYQSQKIIIYHHKLLLFLRGVFFQSPFPSLRAPFVTFLQLEGCCVVKLHNSKLSKTDNNNNNKSNASWTKRCIFLPHYCFFLHGSSDMKMQAGAEVHLRHKKMHVCCTRRSLSVRNWYGRTSVFVCVGSYFMGFLFPVYVCACPCAPVWSSEREMWFNLDK